MSAADVLNRAADLLERHGWCQDVYVDDAGRMCAQQALMQAEPDVYRRATARRVLDEQAGFESLNIPKWNDQPGRTAKQIIAAFRAAAERAS